MNDIIAITKTDNLMDEIRKLAPGRFLDTIPTKNGRELVEKWVSELMTNF